MKKVILLTPGGMPIPVTKGGAVVTLLESLAEVNETERKMDLYITSSYDRGSVEKSKRFKSTHFFYFRVPSIVACADWLLDGIRKLLSFVLGRKEVHRSRLLWKICVLHRTKRILLKNDFDSVVFENSVYLLTLLRNKKIANKYAGKLFFHLHNDIPDGMDFKRLTKCKTLVISNYLRIKIAEKCGPSYAADCLVVKNGIDITKFPVVDGSKKNDLRAKLGIPIEKKVILFVGRITPYKGIMEVVSAFEKLEDPDAFLVVVGSFNFAEKSTSNFEKEIQRRLSVYGDSVLLTGFVPNDQMWLYYSASDLAILPSTWNEPAGLTMVEAVCSGTPLVTTRSGGIPEYVSEKHCIMLENDDCLVDNIVVAIREVFSNYSFYKDKAAKGRLISLNELSKESFYKSFVDGIC